MAWKRSGVRVSSPRHQLGCKSHRLLWLVVEQVLQLSYYRSSDVYAYTKPR